MDWARVRAVFLSRFGVRSRGGVRTRVRVRTRARVRTRVSSRGGGYFLRLHTPFSIVG